MTLAELIKKLQELPAPPETRVMIYAGGWLGDIHDAEVINGDSTYIELTQE